MKPVSGSSIIQPCALERYTHQIDPYIGCQHGSAYCYTLNLSRTALPSEVSLVQDFVGRLRNELSALAPQTNYMGMNTDPYQPIEETRRQTRQLLELLAEFSFPACILTKSDLVVRDIELLHNMTSASVGFSLAFQDEETRIKFEPNAPSNDRRIDALKKLKEVGIETYVLICPVMPRITNVELLIDAVAYIADTIWIYPLRMKSRKDRNWQNVSSLLRKDFPALIDLYQQVIFTKDPPFWVDSSRKLEDIKSKRGLNLRIELCNNRSDN